MHIDPTREQAEAFAAGADDSTPVFMLNLLRFSDAEAYGRYAAAVAPHLERVGGEMIWAGPCDEALIGPGEREWDVAAIVRYPSRSAFLAMVSDPGYLEISKDRSAGLADSRLIPCAAAEIGG